MRRHKPELEVAEVTHEATREETSMKQHGLKFCMMFLACLGPRMWKKIHKILRGAEESGSLDLRVKQIYHKLGKTRRC